VSKSSNIQSEIEIALKKEIGNNLGLIVQNEMEDLPIITQLGVTMSFWGEDDRKALDQLDSIANFSKNITSRKLAEKNLYLKGIEFEKGIDNELMLKFRNSMFNPDSIVTKEDSIRVEKELIKSIFNENSAWKVSYTFVIIRKFSGKHLNNFDFNAVRRMESELN